MGLLSSILVVTNLLFFLFKISYGVLDSITPSQILSDGDTIVSREGKFVLGFFSPGSSKNRYLGIWYKSIPVQTVVWVANRVRPINDTSGILMINSTGNVNVIQNNSVVWSASPLKEAQSPLLQLLDSGNLVVTDGNSEDYLWQSFDYPSDTMLPGMKFGWDLKRGLNRRLIAWKNWDDPSPVNFIFEITLRNYPESCLRRGSTIYFRSGPWNGYGFSGAPGLKPNPVYSFKFVFNQDEAYFMFTLKQSLYSRALPNQTNSMFQRFTWTEQRWQRFISVPIDYCDTYALCGANARCLITDAPVCQCLKGFKPKSQQRWDSLDWSQGCVRNKRLSCEERSTHGFLKFSGLKLPDTTHSWVNTKMNLEECRAECLNNCTCMAYTNSDIREGTGCAIWFGDLVDIKQFPAGGQDLYIRMHPSELGERKKEDVDVPLFDFTTVATATNKFSPANVIGAGGFGPVYKGHLCNGQDIAVKRLSKNSRQGLEEFKNEVVLIAKLQHKNLVKLLGYCVQGEEKMLIYEYMPNKSLDCFIFEQNDTLLAWPKRFDIIIGIVRGLLYLHQDSRLQVIHRDLKASNILLDINLNPKISDFGLARTFVGDESEVKTDRVVGTYGYMSPEYAVDGRFSVKSDVFSMGVLMLEIVSAMKIRKFFHPNHHHNLLGHAWLLWKEGRALELSYTCLEDSHSRSQILRCIQVGLLCVQNFPEDRPIMSCVNSMLTNEEAILPQPKQPGFFIEISPSNSGAILRNEESNIENAVTITMPEAR
ncbi:G-type lectin S-receptor-like serine/threonine-protein kinase At4g27290 isoform X2 [Quercus lobata]|uniref:G-type lectin S-receptor-like serine/threonine-protein kinase At4g27290 isoform X2 n=1 Tax=Quercus lobata TaxID=97700 RepID=UPI001246C1D4|nr:G-type lectin S-receptor-like serine/threonine-protein kinase At4g27290 isoform X2 [Quercus lobata]